MCMHLEVLVAFRQPDPEAVRAEVGCVRQPKDDGGGAQSHRTVPTEQSWRIGECNRSALHRSKIPDCSPSKASNAEPRTLSSRKGEINSTENTAAVGAIQRRA